MGMADRFMDMDAGLDSVEAWIKTGGPGAKGTALADLAMIRETLTGLAADMVGHSEANDLDCVEIIPHTIDQAYGDEVTGPITHGLNSEAAKQAEALIDFSEAETIEPRVIRAELASPRSLCECRRCKPQ